jgi:hypothetical protein
MRRWQGENRALAFESQILNLNPSPAGTSTADSAGGSFRATCKNVFGTNQHYTPPASLTDGSDYTDYACVNLSNTQKWTRYFFKLAVARKFGTGGNSGEGVWVTSNLNAAGHVPEGMVLVAKELWPSTANGNAVDEFPESTVGVCRLRNAGYAVMFPGVMDAGEALPDRMLHSCRYDYAIDKYEPYLASIALTNEPFLATNHASCNLDGGTFVNQNATCLKSLTTNTNNTSNGVLISAKNHATAAISTPAQASWYGLKKGCENRNSNSIMTGFIETHPIVRSRMATGVEWVTAALETPDTTNGAGTYCNIAGSTIANGSSNGKCTSRFGTLNQIGNISESTDEVSFDRAEVQRFYGTSAVSSPFGTSAPFPATGVSQQNVSSWNYLSGFAQTFGGANGDHFSTYWINDFTNPANGGSFTTGVGWNASSRGGSTGGLPGWTGVAAGRFSFRSNYSPLVQMSTRCSITMP